MLSVLMFLSGPALHFSVHFGWLVGLSLRNARRLLFSSPALFLWDSVYSWKTFKPYEKLTDKPSGDLSVMSPSVVEVRLEVSNECASLQKDLLSGPRSTF